MYLLFTLTRKYLLELGKAFIISLFSSDRILKGKAVAKVNFGLTKKSCYCQRHREKERETERQRDRETETERDRERQTQRETERDRDRERQRETETETQREIKVGGIKLNYMA